MVDGSMTENCRTLQNQQIVTTGVPWESVDARYGYVQIASVRQRTEHADREEDNFMVGEISAIITATIHRCSRSSPHATALMVLTKGESNVSFLLKQLVFRLGLDSLVWHCVPAVFEHSKLGL